MAEIEERIVAFIAAELGIKPNCVALTSRISQDLGCDGDDAVELCEKFGEKFHVDLTALGKHWDEHFLPEGGLTSLGPLILIGVCVVLGGFVHEVIRWIPVWASTIVLTAISFWVYGRFFSERDEKKPVTIQDLVDAARSGKWGMTYTDAEPMFRMLR